MLIEQLSVAYKCHSSIGNSTNLKEMIHEILKTFVNETYAIYAEFCFSSNDDANYVVYDSFGKNIGFDFKSHLHYKDSINVIEEKDQIVLYMKVNHGIIFLVSKNKTADCSFFRSMFESLVPKINININACLNVGRLIVSNELLKDEKEKLLIANKTKDDFLANMSHELKTPLNSIIILSSIMKKNTNKALAQKELRNISIINNSANDLLALINDVLDISKIEAGEINILKNSFDLKQFILDEYDILKPLVNKDLVDFTCEFEIKDTEVFSDKLRLKQILKNLLSNAIKFTKEGSIQLLAKEHKDFFEITLKDSGIGIEEDKLAHIFDRFKQIETSTNRIFKGTGLGLAISKELAALLCCSLSVESVVGEGSSFTLKIPKKEGLELCLNMLEKKEKPQVKEVKKESNEINIILEENTNKKDLILIHSKSMKLFSFTIALKKLFNVTPFDSTKKLLEHLNLEDSSDKLIIYDKDITDIEELENLIKTNENESIKFESDSDIQTIITRINEKRK